MSKTIKEINETLVFMLETKEISGAAYYTLQAALKHLDEEISRDSTIYVSHSLDGSDDVYCAFDDFERGKKDSEESDATLREITLHKGGEGNH